MQWFVLLVIAIVFVIYGKRLEPIDEVYALATYGAGTLNVIWGFAIAPTTTQLLFGTLAFGWVQANSPCT
ncbi:MAG: hypothetical protein AAFW75_16625 [Cyanobacteria bacterium J06636_16]